METETPLDRAHRAMEASPEDAAARLAYYAALARADLVLWLEAEPVPGSAELAPRMLMLDEGPVVLAFDGEARLATVAGAAAAYAALPGRVVLARLAGQGVGLGVNLGAEAAFLIDADAVDWAAGVLAGAPRVEEGASAGLAPQAPDALPPGLADALAAALGPVAGGAEVWLAAVEEQGIRRPLVAVAGLPAGAEAAVAQALAEAMAFSGLEAGAADLAVLAADDPRLPGLRRIARRLAADPARPAHPATPPPPRPPRLR